MAEDKEFTRPASELIRSILTPIIGNAGEFTIYRNEASGTYVRVTFASEVFLDIFHKSSEGWMAELWKVTKKKDLNKKFGLHRKLLVPNSKNISNGRVIVTALLPTLESFLTTTPLGKHLTPKQVEEIQDNIAQYKDDQKEQQISKEIKLQDRREISQYPPKSRASTIFWIVLALAAAAILGTSVSGTNDCDFYPDPRGGFTDCS